jgi:hypothetical protein
MSIGKLVRRVLGKRLFARLAHYYRRFFVDLKVAAEVITDHIPPKASILDIGGGDGALLNEFITLRPDVRITAVDIADEIGTAILEEHRLKVRLFPKTSTFDDHELFSENYDVVLLSDVMHHIPVDERIAFIDQICLIFSEKPFILIIKDLEPGYFKTFLGFISDRYISGDRNTKFVSSHDLKKMVGSRARKFDTCIITDLFNLNPPNYCIIFHFEAN